MINYVKYQLVLSEIRSLMRVIDRPRGFRLKCLCVSAPEGTALAPEVGPVVPSGPLH